MAMIRMSPDKMAMVSNMCDSLAEEYNKNMDKTREILQLVDEMWDGPEVKDYITTLQSSFSEIDKTVQILVELSEFLTQAEKNMRLTDQKLTSQLRNGFNDLV